MKDEGVFLEAEHGVWPGCNRVHSGANLCIRREPAPTHVCKDGVFRIFPNT